MNISDRIKTATERAMDRTARAIVEATAKFEGGELSLSAYTALLKQAEELLFQLDRLDAITPKGDLQ